MRADAEERMRKNDMPRGRLQWRLRDPIVLQATPFCHSGKVMARNRMS